MKRLFMFMFSMKSAGGLDVLKALGCKQIRHEGSTFKGDKDTVVINWGWGGPLPNEVQKCKIINKPDAIYKAIRKTVFLDACTKAGVRTVPWTTSKAIAQTWAAVGNTIYCRTRIEGRQGQGIVIAKALGEVVAAPLYSKAIDADREYRVHVCDGKVIAVHRKVHDGETKRHDGTELVRNTENGWLFRRVTIYPKDIITEATKAVKAVGLEFAVVDILYAEEKAYVLEANTAPGIDTMDWTVAQYAKALRTLAEKI